MTIQSIHGWLAVIGAWIFLTGSVPAQNLKDTLQDIDVGPRWSYDDWDAVQAAAAKSQKPILALFR